MKKILIQEVGNNVNSQVIELKSDETLCLLPVKINHIELVKGFIRYIGDYELASN